MAKLLSRSRLQGSVKLLVSGWPDRRSAGSHLTCRWDARRGCEGWPGARAVVACAVRAVTHLLRVRTISVALASHAPTPHRTHALCITLRPARLSCTHRAALTRQDTH